MEQPAKIHNKVQGQNRTTVSDAKAPVIIQFLQTPLQLKLPASFTANRDELNIFLIQNMF